MHPFVVGELACGNLKNRIVVLSYLAALPMATRATEAEVLRLIENHVLWGRGLGWIDAHLLAAALVSHCRLWTLDKRLASAASEMGLSYRACNFAKSCTHRTSDRREFQPRVAIQTEQIVAP